MIEMKTTGSFFTNSYIISNENRECIIVDPGLNYKAISEYIKKNYIPKAILITHAHIDHVDGIQYFLDLPVYIGISDIDTLYDGYKSLYDMCGRTTPYSEGVLNLIPVKHNQIINLIGYEFKVLYTPGHTVGSVCYLENKNLFSGDTLFNNSIGRTDFPTGNYEAMKKSLAYLMNLLSDDVIVYPGHEDITNIGNERKFNPYLK